MDSDSQGEGSRAEPIWETEDQCWVSLPKTVLRKRQIVVPFSASCQLHSFSHFDAGTAHRLVLAIENASADWSEKGTNRS